MPSRLPLRRILWFVGIPVGVIIVVAIALSSNSHDQTLPQLTRGDSGSYRGINFSIWRYDLSDSFVKTQVDLGVDVDGEMSKSDLKAFMMALFNRAMKARFKCLPYTSHVWIFAYFGHPNHSDSDTELKWVARLQYMDLGDHLAKPAIDYHDNLLTNR